MSAELVFRKVNVCGGGLDPGEVVKFRVVVEATINGPVEVPVPVREMFVDGPHLRHPLQFGDCVTVRPARRHPLRVLGLTGVSR